MNLKRAALNASEREGVLSSLFILFIGSLIAAFLVGLVINREWGFVLLAGFAWIVSPICIASGIYGVWTSLATYLSRLTRR